MITVEDFAPVLEAMQSQISVDTVITVLALGVTVSVGAVFMWWGARKCVRMAMAAFRKGKLSI